MIETEEPVTESGIQTMLDALMVLVSRAEGAIEITREEFREVSERWHGACLRVQVPDDGHTIQLRIEAPLKTDG